MPFVTSQREWLVSATSLTPPSHKRKWTITCVFESVPHLQLGVERVSKQLLELAADVQQVDLGATHHDAGQSGLGGPRPLESQRTRGQTRVNRV